jgi:GNAT superfamily N-acetyltransferase
MRSSASSPRSGTVVFRAATQRDAAALAPLVFASGEREFCYMLGATPHDCIAFLRHALARPTGRFSWRRHRVAEVGGQPVAVLSIQDGRANLLDDAHIALSFMRHFGFARTLGIIPRALILDTEIPAPVSKQTLLAHCATRADMRGSGVFSALFEDTLRRQLVPAHASQDLVLDTLLSNARAAMLYRRLGFVELSHRPLRSKRLPVELRSMRMAYRGVA